MIDPEILAAILKELGYFDEYEHPTNKTESESGENFDISSIGKLRNFTIGSSISGIAGKKNTAIGNLKNFASVSS